MYFITLVTQGRACLFGEIVDHAMQLNSVGQIVSAEWLRLPTLFPNLQLDAFVVMPNHIHAILVMTSSTGRIIGSPRLSLPHGPPSGSLGAYIGQFKSRVTKRLHQSATIWQRNYYEHISRDQAEWDHIRQYILDNPQQWMIDDEYFP